MNEKQIKHNINNNLDTFLTIGNDGVAIKSTNYWNTVLSESGLYFLSANAGSLRLLVPSGNHSEVVEHLKEISKTKLATIEASVVKKGALDLVFEDGSDNPFFLCFEREQTISVFPTKMGTKKREMSFLHIYTQDGLLTVLDLQWKI